MKNLLLILMLIPCVAKAQLWANDHPTIKLVAIEKDTADLGDSIWIDFIVRHPINWPYMYTNTQITLSNLSCGTTPDLYYTPSFHYCDTFPVISFSGPDTMRRMEVYIDSSYCTGAGQIISLNDIYADGHKYFYINPPVSTAGIDTYFIPKVVKEIRYYDLAGQEINKPEQSGLFIVKTTYTDGSVKTKKVFTIDR